MIGLCVFININAQSPLKLWSTSHTVDFFNLSQVSFSTDSKYFVIGNAAGKVTIYESATGEPYNSYAYHKKGVLCTVFQPGGQLIASGDNEGRVILYNYVKNDIFSSFLAHDAAITSICFSSNGKFVFTTSRDKMIKIWNVALGTKVNSFAVKDNVKKLAITNDDKFLIVGNSSLSNGINIYDAFKGVRSNSIETANIQDIAISPDGKYIASANLERNVYVWNLKAPMEVFLLEGHKKWMASVAFSPVGTILASGSDDKTIILWDYTQKTNVATLIGKKPIEGLAFSPNGKYFAAMNEDGTVTIWDVSYLLPVNLASNTSTLSSETKKDVATVLIPYRSGNYWGYSDENKNIVIDVQYKEAEPFYDGFAVARTDKENLLIDVTGKVIESSRIGYYRQPFVNGWTKMNGKYISKTGKMIDISKYFSVGDFHDGLAFVMKGNYSGYIDTTGTEVIPLKYTNDIVDFKDGISCVRLNGKRGFIDKTGKTVIPFIFDFCFDFYNDLAYVEKDNKCGFIDRKGNIVIPYKYDFVEYGFNQAGLAIVGIKDNKVGELKYGLIDKTGKEINKFEYTSIGDPFYTTDIEFYDGLIPAEKNKKWGYLNTKGELVIPNKYDSVSSFVNGKAIVKIGKTYAFIDKTGKEILLNKYNTVKSIDDGMSLVVVNNKYGVIDINGKEIITPSFDFIEGFSIEGLSLAKIEKKYGYINKKGNIVIPFKYDFAESFDNGIAKVLLNDMVNLKSNWGYISKTGVEYWE